MARIWSTGFENQSVTGGVELETIINSPTINTATTAAIHGGGNAGLASLRTNPTSTTASFRQPLASSSFLSQTLYARFYLYIASSTGALVPIFRFTATSTDRMSVRLNSNNTLELWNGSAQVGSDSSALSANTWYRIEVAVTINGAGIGTDIEAKIDGTTFASAASQSIGAIDTIAMGVISSTTCDLYFDDVAINNNSGSYQNSWPGEGYIIHMRPSGAGASAQWRPLSGSNYDNVDEVVPDDASSYVDTQARANNDVDTYAVADTPAHMDSSATVNVVSVGVRYARSASNTSDTFTPQFTANSGTNADVTFQANGSSFRTNANTTPRNYQVNEYGTPGNNATALTKSHLDAATLGLKIISAANNNDARVSTLWALVDYTPSSGTNVSVSDSITVSENVPTPTVSYSINVSDSVTVTESAVVEIAPNAFTISVSDTVTLSESVNTTLVHNAKFLGALVVNESMASSPSTGTLKNDAAWNAGGYLRFTSAVNFQSGQIEYTDSANQVVDDFETSYEGHVGGGDGADALYFYWGASSTPTSEENAVGGYIVAYSEYHDKVKIFFNGSELNAPTLTGIDDGQWHRIRIVVRGLNIKAFWDETLIADFTDTTRTLGGTLFGWGGRTGGLNHEHRVRNITLTSGGVSVIDKPALTLVSLVNVSDSITLSESVSKPDVSYSISASEKVWVREQRRNLVLNPSFETNTSAWTLQGVHSRSNDRGYEGSYSLKFTGTNQNTALSSQGIDVVGGETYTLSAMLYKVAGYSGDAYIDIMEYDIDDVLLVDGAGSFSTTTDAWERVVVTQTMNANTAYVQIRLVTDNNSTGTIYADLFTFEVGGDFGTCFSGATTNALWESTAHLSASNLYYSQVSAAAGAALTISVSDSITVSESTSQLLTSFVSTSESVTLTENVTTPTVSYSVSESESITVTESASVSYPLMQYLFDDFDFGGNDTGKWSTWGSITATATTNLVAELTSTTAANYGGYLSLFPHNLTGSYAFSQLVDAGNQSITSLEVYPVELSHGSNALSVMLNLGTVYARKKVSGSYSTVGTGVTYNATTMQWFRVRESGGTIYWEYAQDPTGSWTTIASQATPFDITQMTGGFTIGTWQTEGSTSTIKIDNYNVLPGTYQFSWKGYTWNKRIHQGSPSNNQVWDYANVTGPDGNDYITTKLTNPNLNGPVGSELFSAQRGFGYGTYIAVIGTRLDNIHEAVGFGGMFTFDFTAPPDYKEIDVHETRHYNGSTNKRILHSHVYNNGGVRAFIVDDMDIPSDVVQTHRLIWTPTKLIFDSFIGTGTAGTNYFHTEHNTNIPVPNLERVHFNVWSDTSIAGYKAATPLDVVIRDFTFVPDKTLSVSDSVTITESTQVARVSNLSVSDTVTLSESVAKPIVSYGVSASESITVTESATVSLGTLSLSVSDNVTVTESTTQQVTSFISTSDSVTLTESVALTKILNVIAQSTTDTGLLSPAVSQGNFNVTTPDNAFSSDDNYAVFDGASDEVSYGNFGISIPAGSTIVGIEVVYEGKANSATGQPDLGARLSWNNGTNNTSYKLNTSGMTTSDATYTLGGAADVWGHTWSASELGNGNFIVNMIVSQMGAATTISLDHVQVRVTYTINGETITVTESASALKISDISVSDSITLTENVAASVSTDVIASDTVTVTESAAVALGALGSVTLSVSDTITVSESTQLELNSFISVSDSITLTENIAVLLVSLISVSDTVTLSESVALLLAIFVSASETITLSESVAAYVDTNVSASDSVTVSESVALATALGISVSDSVTLSESLALLLIAFVSAVENITITESVSTYVDTSLSASDSVTITESVSLTTALAISVSDTVTISENIATLLVSNVSVSDSITLTESTAQEVTRTLSVSDSVTLTENVVVAQVYTIAVADNVTLSESVAVTSPLTISVSDSIMVSESTAFEVTRTLSTSDTVTLTESVSLSSALEVSASDSITVTESTQQTLIDLVSVSDTVTLTESVALDVFFPVTAQETITITEELPHYEDTIYVYESVTVRVEGAAHPVTTSDSVTVSESVLMEISTSVSATDSITITENTALSPQSFISTNDTVTVSENILLTLVSLASASDTISTTESVSASVEAYPIASDTVTVTENVSVAQVFNISVSDTVTLSESVSGYVETNISTSETITVAELVDILLISLLSVSDNITVSEQVSVVKQAVADADISVSDSITVSESAAASLGAFALLESEMVEVSENVALVVSDPQVIASDNITVSENVELLRISDVRASETITITESVALVISTEVTATDTITVDEATQIALISLASTSDTVTLSESVQASLETNVSVSDTVTLTENVNIAQSYALSVAEAITITESVSLVVSDPQVIASDTITVTDTPNVAQALQVVTSDSITVTDSLIEIGFVTIVEVPPKFIFVDGRLCIRIVGNHYTRV
jgi:hypothetical protein